MPQSPPTPEDELLTDQAAARRLGVSVATVRRMRRDGELSFVRVRHSVRIPMSDVLAYLHTHRSQD